MFGLSEELNGGEGAKGDDDDSAHPYLEVAHGELDLGVDLAVETSNCVSQFVAQLPHVMFRGDRIAQRLVECLGVGAGLRLIDARRFEPIDIDELVEGDLGGGHGSCSAGEI